MKSLFYQPFYKPFRTNLSIDSGEKYKLVCNLKDLL